MLSCTEYFSCRDVFPLKDINFMTWFHCSQIGTKCSGGDAPTRLVHWVLRSIYPVKSGVRSFVGGGHNRGEGGGLSFGHETRLCIPPDWFLTISGRARAASAMQRKIGTLVKFKFCSCLLILEPAYGLVHIFPSNKKRFFCFIFCFICFILFILEIFSYCFKIISSNPMCKTHGRLQLSDFCRFLSLKLSGEIFFLQRLNQAERESKASHPCYRFYFQSVHHQKHKLVSHWVNDALLLKCSPAFKPLIILLRYRSENVLLQHTTSTQTGH